MLRQQPVDPQPSASVAPVARDGQQLDPGRDLAEGSGSGHHFGVLLITDNAVSFDRARAAIMTQ